MPAHLEGMEEVLHALQDLRRGAKGDVLSEAGLFAIEPMLQAARSKAPRDTGDLERGMGKEILDKQPVMRVAMGPDEDQFYALFMEKGWRPSGRSKTTSGLSLGTYTKGRWKGSEIRAGGWSSLTQVPPRPFMRPAFDTRKDTVFEWFANFLSHWFDSNIR